ncbi:hypothetical protein AB9M62_25320 [Bacillales bacterium AN1005]
MKKLIVFILTLIVIGVTSYFIYSHVNAGESNKLDLSNKDKETIKLEKIPEYRADIPLDKVWEFSAEKEINESSLDSDSVYITDEDRKKLDVSVSLSENKKVLTISPPEKGFEKGQSYLLHIDKKIKYTDNTNVKSNYNLHFYTKRDEVEQGTVSKEIIMVDDTYVKVIDKDSLKINKDGIKKELKVNDIIIFPTKDHPEGQAVKITKLKSSMGNYTVTVKEPKFTELYSRLDIYKSYPITEENFTPSKELEGMTVEYLTKSNSSNQVSPLVAGINTTKVPDSLEEFKDKKSTITLKPTDDHGLSFTFSDFNLYKEGGNSLQLNGKIILRLPKVNVDINSKSNKYKVDISKQIQDDISLAYNSDKKYIDKKKEIKIKTIDLGEAYIPTAVPGLIINVDLVLKTEVKVNGKVEVFIELNRDDTIGFIYENDEFNPINLMIENDNNVGIEGEGAIDAKTGPALDLLVTGFGVIGAGIENAAGLKLEGAILAGLDSKQSLDKPCIKYQVKPFFEASFLVGIIHSDLIFKYVMVDPNLGTFKNENTCIKVTEFEPIPKEVLNSGDKKNIEVNTINYDFSTKDESKSSADMDKVDIKVSKNGVVSVEPTDDGIKIKVNELPSDEKVDIILSLKDNKKITTKIPIEIKDYEEVTTPPTDSEIKDIIKKSYQLSEAMKKNSEDNLEGDFDAFVADLEPYFTNSYIKSLPLEAFSVATDYPLPYNFDFDRHFEVTSNSADQVVAEAYQTDEMSGPVIYTVTAIKEAGQWKIDNFTYEYVEEEAAGTNSTYSSGSDSRELLDKDDAKEIISNYLEGYDGVRIESIITKSEGINEDEALNFLDEDAYFAVIYYLTGEGESRHETPVYLEINRHTGEVNDVTIEYTQSILDTFPE